MTRSIFELRLLLNILKSFPFNKVQSYIAAPCYQSHFAAVIRAKFQRRKFVETDVEAEVFLKPCPRGARDHVIARRCNVGALVTRRSTESTKGTAQEIVKPRRHAPQSHDRSHQAEREIPTCQFPGTCCCISFASLFVDSPTFSPGERSSSQKHLVLQEIILTFNQSIRKGVGRILSPQTHAQNPI